MPSEREARPAVTFSAQNAAAYEEVMGRWSRRLSPLLIRFGGLKDGDRVLDVGCGTGSLTFSIPEEAKVHSVVGIDQAKIYVDYASARCQDPRISFRHGDARELPFPDDSFDRAFCLLVLQFIPDAPQAVAEMVRVVRPGGTVAAAVWDNFGGTPATRLFWDIAATLDSSVTRMLFRPMTAPGQLAATCRAQGLVDVEETNLLIRMEYSCFDDYWLPMIGEGVMKQLVESLPAATRERFPDHMREAYLAGAPDGARSFAAVTWACKGTVPG